MLSSVFLAMTLDGCIARPDGTLGYLDAFGNEEHGYTEFSKSIDVMVMGRSTYDFVMGAVADWPWPGKRVIVLTTRPPQTKRADEAFFSGDVRALHATLQREGCRRAYVDGGKVIMQFLDADLIDEMIISVVPMRLGAGIPLFTDGPERHFTLVSAQAFASGIAQLRYARKAA